MKLLPIPTVADLDDQHRNTSRRPNAEHDESGLRRPTVSDDGSRDRDMMRRAPTWWQLTWTCGPDAGGTFRLPAGRHLVGRSPLAAVRCADPALEPFHLELDLPAVADAPPAWCQLAGRRPVLADGSGDLEIGTSVLAIRPTERADHSDDLPGGCPADPVAWLLGADGASATDRMVVRRARRRPEQRSLDRGSGEAMDRDGTGAWDGPDGPDGPDGVGGVDRRDRSDEGESHVAVAPALVTLTIGVAIAVAMRQPMFAVMGAMGAAIAISTWVIGRLRRKRRARRRVRQLADESAHRSEAIERHRGHLCVARRLAQPGLIGAVAIARAAPAGLWQRRPDHGDAFTVVLGIGAVRVGRHPGRSTLVLERVPITIDVAAGARVAITGPNRLSAVRALIVQLAVTTGPADWELLVVSSSEERWHWAAGLPQVRLAGVGGVAHDAAALADVVAEVIAGVATERRDRHLLVVTDDVDEVAVRASALRRMLDHRPEVGLVACVPAGREVPAVCSVVALTTADGGLRIDHDGCVDGEIIVDPIGGAAGGVGTRCRLTGLGEVAAAELGGSLARWTDPEAPADRDRALPSDVPLESLLVGMFGTERSGIVAGWRTLGPDAPPRAPLGMAGEGVVDIDLVRDGPHALVAGTTGSGKSELLRALVVSLAASVPPDQLAFVLVDFKGGATFDDLTALAHVVGVVTDLEPRLADRVLRSLRAEVTAREHLLRRHGCSDLSAARERLGQPVVPRLVIIIDEFAALAMEHPHLLHSLVDVARRGRSLGVHLILATQRPSGVVSDEIRTNTDLRIALRLHEGSEAVDVVGDAEPASFRRSAAGRAVVRLGPGDRTLFQSARVRSPRRLIEEIAAAADAYGAAAPTRPWCEPLPLVFDPLSIEVLPRGSADEATVPAGRGDVAMECQVPPGVALGIVDRPDAQRQDLLRWQPSDGHVLVIGSAGSGVTTALASAAVRSLDHGGAQRELLVIDAIGDGRWDEVARLARCAGVVRLHEHERLERACARAMSMPPPGGRVVVIDGIGALRRDVEAPSRSAVHDQIESLLLDTPAGVTLLLGNDGVSGLGPSVVARCARRWLLHLHDPNDGATFGVRAAALPPAIPGRMVDASDGSEAQLAGWPTIVEVDAPPIRPTGAPAESERVERIEVLPDRVAARDLPPSGFDGAVWRPMLGISHRSLQPISLEVPLGEHLLVVGPARSGRSEVLVQLRRCWSEARPDAAQVVLAPRRLPTGDVAAAAAEAIEHVERDLDAGRPVLLVVDDAELITDVGAHLMGMIVRRPSNLTVVASCRGDAVRSSYGHWLGELRRSRRGVVMAAGSDLDGDALGVVLPRHPPVRPRPGLCWLVADGSAVAAQAAISC